MLKTTLCRAALALLALPAAAQTMTINGVSNIGSAALSPIYAGQEVKGYVLINAGDRTDRRNEAFRFDFYDENLAKAASLNIERPIDRFHPLQTVFNGQVFCQYAFNGGLRRPELEIYDPSLKLLVNKPLDVLSDSDFDLLVPGIQYVGREKPRANHQLVAVPNQGFVRTTSRGDLRRYGLEMYDNRLNLRWQQASDPKAPGFETLRVLGTTEQYVLATVGRRATALGLREDLTLLGLDVATGRPVLSQPLESGPADARSLHSLTYDAARREFVAVGEYYAPGAKPGFRQSLGFFVRHFDETGKPGPTQQYAWQQEVKAALSPAAQAGLAAGDAYAVQDVQTSPTGQRYLVCEAFRTTAAAGNPKYAATARVKELRAGPLVVLVLGPDGRLGAAHEVTKPVKTENTYLGEAMAGQQELLVAEAREHPSSLGYLFTQASPDNTRFNAVYLVTDRTLLGKVISRNLGNLAFGGPEPVVTDRLNVANEATRSYFYPAKLGYVLQVDFDAEAKRVELKLVKLNI